MKDKFQFKVINFMELEECINSCLILKEYLSFMKGNSWKELDKDTGDAFISMENIMKDSGRMIDKKEKVYISILMEITLRGNLHKIFF